VDRPRAALRRRLRQSESLAVFRLAADGTLTRVNDQPIPSHGTSPCSLCISGDQLYVVNQHIRSSGGKAEPNLAVFALRGESVTHLPGSSFAFRRGESPTQAIANPQGTVLAVPSVRARKSLLHCYAIDPKAAGKAGLLSEFANSPFEITDTGYGFGSTWTKDGKTLFMTNAIGAGSVVRLAVDAGARQIAERARATTPGNACWSALSRDGKRLYVANLLALIVFDVTGGGLKQVQTLPVTDVKDPVLRDLILTPDGRFLYAIEQRRRRILTYAIGKDGSASLAGERAVGSAGYTLGLAIA
jgi:6-phosphogluconolactonase